MMPTRTLTAVVAAVLLLSGCSLTFHRHWNVAPVPPDSIEGQWEGLWKSDVNGHTGRLRCIVTRIADDQYRARFQAVYWKLFRFTHTVVLETRETDGSHTLHGSANLGWWAGGEYKYEGETTATEFTARYESSRDHGVFEMRR